MFDSNSLTTQVVHTPEFQRLKRISQHGIASHSNNWPKTYSRYEHSLGTAAITKQWIKHLLYFVDDLDHRTKRALTELVPLAALIHDIGHCMMSHDFDCFILPMLKIHLEHNESKYSEWLAPNWKQRLEKLACHEQRGQCLWRAMWQKYSFEYQSLYVDDKEDAHLKLDKHDVELVCWLIEGKLPTAEPVTPWTRVVKQHPWILEIINSKNIDSDKMDYLIWDGHLLDMIGYKDPLQSLDFNPLEIIQDSEIQDKKLVFGQKARHEISKAIMLRKELYRQKYFSEAFLEQSINTSQFLVLQLLRTLTSSLGLEQLDLKRDLSTKDIVEASCPWIRLVEWSYPETKQPPKILKNSFRWKSVSYMKHVSVPQTIDYSYAGSLFKAMAQATLLSRSLLRDTMTVSWIDETDTFKERHMQVSQDMTKLTYTAYLKFCNASLFYQPWKYQDYVPRSLVGSDSWLRGLVRQITVPNMLIKSSL